MSVTDAVPYSEYLGCEAPFMDHVGLKTRIAADGKRVMVLKLERRHLNSASNTHGGVVLTMLDVAMAAACRLGDPGHRNCVTVEMKTTFMRPGGGDGETIEARGIVRHATKSLVFCDGELRGEDGALLATASGTFKYLDTLKAAPASDG